MLRLSLARRFKLRRWRVLRSAIGTAAAQIEVGARKRETVGHGGRRRRGLIETEDLAATVAAKMDVLGVFAFGRDGKAEHTLGVGALVRQTLFKQPVEHAL